MKQFSIKKVAFKLFLLLTLVLPGLASAQTYFNYNQYGDVMAGFRKTGVNAGLYELVVDLGNVTNFLKLSAGTTTSITAYSASVMTNSFIDTGDFANIQWSVFCSFPGNSSWVTPVATFPRNTIWYSIPATDINTQTQPPLRDSYNAQANTKNLINSVGTGAYAIGSGLNTTNVNNNTVLVREPTAFIPSKTLTAFIGDYLDPAVGDFGSGGTPLAQPVENMTPEPFDSAQRNDLYQLVPSDYTDPLNGTTTTTYFVGYFILNPNGTMTFTRASSATPPAASFTGGPTNGFAGFTAMFTNISTGTITNWIWDFGDGTIITNATGVNVSHTYATGGSYNVTLTVSGPGGSNAKIQSSFIQASPLPTMIARPFLASGQFVLGGSNCPAGVQYRILNSSNVALPIGSWIPVKTNVFLSDGTYSYTNLTAQSAGFFRLVSP